MSKYGFAHGKASHEKVIYYGCLRRKHVIPFLNEGNGSEYMGEEENPNTWRSGDSSRIMGLISINATRLS